MFSAMRYSITNIDSPMDAIEDYDQLLGKQDFHKRKCKTVKSHQDVSGHVLTTTRFADAEASRYIT